MEGKSEAVIDRLSRTTCLVLIQGSIAVLLFEDALNMISERLVLSSQLSYVHTVGYLD